MTVFDKPLKIIEPRSGFNIIKEIRDIWQHRELLYLLAWRDYKVRYRQTIIGIAWAILQPVLAMLAFVFIFGRFKEITDSGVPYAIFVYSGLILWQLFSNAVNEASTSLVMSSQIITKIYFPRILVPLAKALTTLIDFVISLVILVILLLFFGIFPPLLSVIYMIPVILITIIFSTSLGILLSAFNVKYRDVQYALPYFVQLSLFLSPVIYSGKIIGNLKNIIVLNPLTGLIEAFRSLLFSSVFPTTAFAVALLVTLLLFMFSMNYFIKAEGAFSDVI